MVSKVVMYCDGRFVHAKDNLGAPNVTSLLTEVAGPSAYGTCLGMAGFEVIVCRFLGVSGPEAVGLGSRSMILIGCPCRNGGNPNNGASLDLVFESGEKLWIANV